MIEWHGSDRMSPGQRIATARTRLGLSQFQLAKRLAMPHHRLANIERGATDCSPALLALMAEKLGVPFRELRGEAPAP